MHIILLAIVFLWGLAIGSFINVCVYRLPRSQSIVLPRSFCPRCRAPIAWHDNIPLLSYLVLKGKCRCCGGRISARYPLVELLTGLLFVAVHLQFIAAREMIFFSRGVVLPLFIIPFRWYFVASLLALSLIDKEHYLLPDRLTYPLIIVGLALAAICPDHFLLYRWGSPSLFGCLSALRASALGLLVGGLSLWIVGAAGKAVLKKEAMGLGDVKLMAAVGAWQGWPMALLAIFLAALVASIVGVALILLRRARWGTKLPFGPYLALGSLLTLFFGKGLLLWYLTLFAH